jgi:hypothetical protein
MELEVNVTKPPLHAAVPARFVASSVFSFMVTLTKLFVMNRPLMIDSRCLPSITRLHDAG